MAGRDGAVVALEGSWTATLNAESCPTLATTRERVTYTVELASLQACQHWAFRKVYELGNLRYQVKRAIAIGPDGQEYRLELPL